MQPPLYVPSPTFTGARAGYVFTKGDQGVGYYLDGPSSASDGQVLGSKRGASELGEEGGGGGGGGAKRAAVDVDAMELEDLDEETIARMLEEADKQEVTEVDLNALRQMLLTLEKRITANQKARVKHPDEPDKFVETEVDLDEAIKALSAVATAPDLYPKLVELGAVSSLLGLLTHDNTDISISAVTALQELTDSDVLAESDEALCIVDAIVSKHGLVLMVQNLGRLDESNDDDARGVYNTLAVVENLLEAKPTVGPLMCEETGILQWLLKRVRTKAFDDNKLYASELLNVLANSDTAIQRRLGDIGGTDGVDQLLQACAQYRRRDPTTPEEEECVENLFGTLAATQLVPENQSRFKEGEGFELMIRCLREKKYAAWCAIKVLDFATTNNPTNCEHLVECGGLKVVFPVFMGRAAARKLRKARKLSKGDARSLEEHCISLVSSLSLYLDDKPGRDSASRLAAKFIEDDFEKVDRLMELYVEYAQRVTAFERRAAAEADDVTSPEDAADRELDALAAGGYTLQRLAALMAAAAARSPRVAERVEAKLHQHGLALRGVRAVIAAYIESLGTDAAARALRAKLTALMPVEEGAEGEADAATAAAEADARAAADEERQAAKEKEAAAAAAASAANAASSSPKRNGGADKAGGEDGELEDASRGGGGGGGGGGGHRDRRGGDGRRRSHSRSPPRRRDEGRRDDRRRDDHRGHHRSDHRDRDDRRR